MIIRTLADSTILEINVSGNHSDEQFLAKNPTGGFSSVESLPESKWRKWKIVDSVIVVDTAAEAVCDANMYKEQRSKEYPPIAEQLDMIYHNGDGGATFQAAIKAVKDRYPKE